MKKFALVSHVLPPSWSGQSVVLGRILLDINPSAYILISKNNKHDEDLNSNNNLPAKRVQLIQFQIPQFLLRFGFFNRLAFYIDLYLRAIQIIDTVKKEKCQCIISCSGDLIDIPSAYIAGRLTGKNVIPYYFDDYVFQWADGFSRKFAQTFENRIFRQYSMAIVPNEFMKAELERRQPVHASIIRNPVNFDSEINPAQKYVPNEKIRIVYTGALYHVNISAFRTLIEAMQSVPKIELHLFTAQPVEMLIKEGITGSSVHFHNHTSTREVALAQQKADILLIPFSFNSTVPEVIKTSAPGKLADYLASGVPILAFVPMDSFVAWFLKKHQCGVVIDENDSNTLAKGIKELIKNSQLREEIVKNAIVIAEKEFSIHKARLDFMDIVSRS